MKRICVRLAIILFQVYEIVTKCESLQELLKQVLHRAGRGVVIVPIVVFLLAQPLPQCLAE
jgi:hypothetical protein